jgi:hypothetical protein
LPVVFAIDLWLLSTTFGLILVSTYLPAFFFSPLAFVFLSFFNGQDILSCTNSAYWLFDSTPSIVLVFPLLAHHLIFLAF